MNTKNKGLSSRCKCLAGLSQASLAAYLLLALPGSWAFSAMFGHAIKMVVMPLIFLSVTVGVFRAGRLRERLGKVALSSIVFFVLMTGLAASLGLLLNFAFRPGLGASLTHSGSMPAALASSIDWTKFLVDLIPANIVAALAAGNSLPVLVFGVIFGAALAAAPERAEPAIAVFEALLSGLFKMTQWVIAWSPLAIFAAIAQLLSAKGFAGVHSLVELLGVAYLGMAILAVILTLVIRVAGQSPRRSQESEGTADPGFHDAVVRNYLPVAPEEAG